MIRNYNGNTIDILNFQPRHIDLSAIGISLSRLPRFGGHTLKPYSVLAHTVIGVQALELMFAAEHEKAAYFCHDMSEGILGVDVPSPVKACCSDFREIENDIQDVLFNSFELKYTHLTHQIDSAMGYLEADLLMKGGNKGWVKPEFDLGVFEEIVDEIRYPKFTKHYLEKYSFYCDSLLGVTV